VYGSKDKEQNLHPNLIEHLPKPKPNFTGSEQRPSLCYKKDSLTEEKTNAHPRYERDGPTERKTNTTAKHAKFFPHELNLSSSFPSSI
jgi:hypothetical protein